MTLTSNSTRRLIQLLILLVVVIAVIVILKFLVFGPTYSHKVLKNGAQLQQVACWFKVPKNKTMRCYYFTSAPQKKAQKHLFVLPVVYVQHDPNKIDPTPLIFISGGPGYAVGIDRNGIYGWLEWVRVMNWNRDIVFFDQRGVGMGRPSVHCPKVTALTVAFLAQDKNAKQDALYWTDIIKKCRQHFDKSLEVDLITTQSTVDDIVNIAKLLPAKQWNLYGISYGTRVALELMKRQDIQLRAVILDSVYPQNKNELLVTPKLMHDAIERLFDECRLSYFCKTKAPDLQKKFKKIIADLDKKPITLTLKPRTHKTVVKVTVNSYRFVWAIFQSMYSWKSIEKIPHILNQAAAGNHAALKPLMTNFADYALDYNFSMPAFYSVECNDREKANYDEEYKKAIEAFPFYKPYTKYYGLYDVCKVWTTQRAPKSSFELTRSTIPTLILNGELDPVTPWTWAKETASLLPNSYLFVVKGIGHGVVDSDVCSREIAKAFLAMPNKNPRQTCATKWSRADFSFGRSN